METISLECITLKIYTCEEYVIFVFFVKHMVHAYIHMFQHVYLQPLRWILAKHQINYKRPPSSSSQISIKLSKRQT